MKYQHPQEILRVIKALLMSQHNYKLWGIDSPTELGLITLDECIDEYAKKSIYRWEQMGCANSCWLILSSICNTAYIRIIMDYIRNNDLETRIIDNIKQYVYVGTKSVPIYHFLWFLKIFVAAHCIKKEEFNIDLVVAYYCNEFAPTLVRETRCGSSFFQDLFVWNRSAEGFSFWDNHHSEFYTSIKRLSLQQLLRLQLTSNQPRTKL